MIIKPPTVALSTQRLSAEQLRDSMLAVSGELREMNGGPR